MEITINKSTSKTEDIQRLLIVLGAAIGMSGGFATLFLGTASVFLKPIAMEYFWSRSEVSAMLMFAMLGLAFSGPLIGMLIDKLGTKRVVLFSILILSLGLFTLSKLPKNYFLFSLICFVIGLAGAGTSPPGYLSVFPRWFNARLGLALGCAMFGVGIGAFAMPIILQSVLTNYGWRTAYAASSLMALGLGCVSLAFIFQPWKANTRDKHNTNTNTNTTISRHGDSALEAFKSKRFWILAAVLFLIAAAGIGATIHAVALFSDRGLTPDFAVRAASMIGAGLAAGRIIAGVLMDRLHAPVVAAGSFVIGATGLLIINFSSANSFANFAIGALLLGFTLGVEGDIMPYFVRRYFGTKSFATIYGILFGFFSIGGVVGPITYGLIFDINGSYFWACALAAGICLLCSATVLTVGKYRYS